MLSVALPPNKLQSDSVHIIINNKLDIQKTCEGHALIILSYGISEKIKMSAIYTDECHTYVL